MLSSTLSLISAYRGTQPEDFFAACLPTLRADLPNLSAMRVYRIAHGALVIWWSSSDNEASGTRQHLSNFPLHQRTIEQRSTQIESNRVVLPLVGHELLYGLLELSFSAIEADSLASLEQTVGLLSMRLENLLVNRLMEQEISASSALNTCEDFKQIAAVLADYFVSKSQYMAIVLYERDANGQIIGMRNVATANRQRSFSTDELIPVSPQLAQAHHQQLTQHGEFFVTDVDSDPKLLALRLWLKQYKIRSMYHSALRSSQEVYGFISWNDTSGTIALTELETLAYSTLVEQAASVIDNRRIASERLALLEESRRQALSLQAITSFGQSVQATQNIEDILDLALNTLSQLLAFDHAEIFGYDRSSKRLRLMAQQSFGRREVISGAGLAIELEEDTARQAAQHRHPAHQPQWSPSGGTGAGQHPGPGLQRGRPEYAATNGQPARGGPQQRRCLQAEPDDRRHQDAHQQHQHPHSTANRGGYHPGHSGQGAGANPGGQARPRAPERPYG